MAAVEPWTPTDPLGEALHQLRMRATFYCRTEATAPWALEMPEVADSISVHVVVDGTCWLDVPHADQLELRAGDVALVPHGRGHLMRSEPGVGPAGRVDHLPQQYLGEHYSVLTYGGGGAATRLVCGVLVFDDPGARALMRVLPPILTASAAAGLQPTLIHETIRLMANELQDLRPGGEAVTTRLADILVIQAIRTWLDRDPAARRGWLGALRDDRIGLALAAVHRDPGGPWSVQRLAREATMSRSAFASRFHELVGEPAMSYVTRWRMQVAHGRLAAGDATVSEVARAVGYRSEAAFSRAFARVTGQTPGAARRARPQPV